MKGRLIIAIAAGVAVVVLAGSGAYVYFFSGLRSSPSALGLSATPSPAATGTPTSVATGSLAGTWTVTAGSLAGYRVKELFVGETSKHEAVARTSSVSGTLTVSGDSSAYQVTGITFTAALTDLRSVDSVAGRDVRLRDSFVSRQMNLQQFPNATFTASSGSVPATDGSGKVDVSAAGKLTIHGVTKDVTTTAKAQLTGGKVEIAGNLSIDMTDYGVSPPSVPFTTVDSQVTIEFDLFLTRPS
jgi:polyisoprenoid-binding protein YceI